MDRASWLEQLRPGSEVVVVQPWNPGKPRTPAIVTEVVRNGIVNHIHVEGWGVFHGKTGKTGPYEYIDPPQNTEE